MAPPSDPTAAGSGSGAVSLTAIGTAATENFNTLALTGTSSTLPTGWYFDETGGSSNALYAAGTGSGNTGDTYSFGSAGSTERAFGQLRSANVIPVLGAQFTNNTGSAIGSLDIAYTGEQWRLGATGRADSMNFQISFDATSLTTGTWTTVSQLGFTGPISTGVLGALDGNAAANRTAISYTLALANAIASGQTFWVRWTDNDVASSDDGLGIDDFSIRPNAAVANNGSLAINDLALAEGNGGTTNFTFTVTRGGGSTGAVGATWALANGTTDNADFTTFPQTGTVSFADGETSKTITIAVAGDTTFEGNDTFLVNLTAPTGGATISDAQGQGTITNDDAAPTAQLAIGDVTLVEGNGGTTNFVFTVTRGGDTAIAASATWTVANGTTDAADFTGALTGTVAFAAGETSQTITVGVSGDTAVEPNETFTVNLTNPSVNTTITDAQGAGTITNDDAPPVANVWVNEINYDPAGTDANEFIEIAGLAGTDLTGWSLVLYNGNGGAVYSTLGLSGTIANSTNGFGFLKVNAAGLQNGSPDGIALVDAFGRVVQFLSYEGPMTAVGGPANGLTSTDIGVEQTNAAIGFTLQLTGSGSSYGDFTWAANVANTEGAVNAGQTFLSGTDQGQIRIGDASVTEGNSGTASLTFTVSRAGGFASAASVDYQVLLNGTANAADLAAGAILSGTVSFAAGEFTRTIVVGIAGDTVGEFNETLSVQLANAVGNVAIADGVAIGTIVNDDPLPLAIYDIQGAGHRSAYVGQTVITSGIVTAVDTNGFYLQDPAGDGNQATSDAVFVFTGTAPSVAVGDGVSVSAVVAEFASGAGLPVTQLNPTGVTVNSTGNALPSAVLIGTGGLLPPTAIIDNDGLTSFDPATDGIDFWESLEGMRVTIDNPLVVSNTNSFGETDVVASLGLGATGVNARGGITISGGDYNPEKIQIDDRFGALIGYTPNHTIGDRLASVTGVLNYGFEHYELLATQAVTVTQDVTLSDEQTALQAAANYLTIATYNVENMDPSDNKYSILGHDIVYNLRAPTIVALQEVQDADGAGSGSDLSGVSNVQGLIDAIFAESGIVYTYVEIAPDTANSTGGEPNGNIRNGYLYRADQVSLVSGSLALIVDSAFNGSRKPLVATWLFEGREFTTVNVHFTSRGGSDPLWGASQPPADAGDAARTAQAAAVGAYVNNHLATDPALNYMVLGDWNGFYFEQAQTQLTSGGVFTNLAQALLPSEERYSYVFEGNSQLIDNILVTGRLLFNAQIDAVHLNAEFGGTRPTDHDPQVARIYLGPAPVANADSATRLETQPATGNVLTNDTGPATTVTAVNGQASNVGTQITLPSGALLTLNADGTYTYNANGAFSLVDAASGAANTQATDSFTYTIAGGGTATVTLTINGVSEAGDTYLGSVANDTITGTNFGETFDVRQGGTDTVIALAGNDRVLAGNGASVDGGADTDTLAISGSVTLGALAGFEAIEFLSGGALTLTAAQFNGGLTPTAALSGTGSLTIDMGAGDSELYLQQLTGSSAVLITANGTAADDVIKGAPGFSNTLNGGDGFDFLRGGQMSDVINGGNGDDKIEGGQGADTFSGGAGADVFRYQSANASGLGGAADQITDFAIGTDKLGFQLIDADPVAAGDQAFGFIGTAAFTNTGVGQIRYQGSGANLLVQVDVDGNGVADMEIVLQGLNGQVLTSGDFLL